MSSFFVPEASDSVACSPVEEKIKIRSVLFTGLHVSPNVRYTNFLSAWYVNVRQWLVSTTCTYNHRSPLAAACAKCREKSRDGREMFKLATRMRSCVRVASASSRAPLLLLALLLRSRHFCWVVSRDAACICKMVLTTLLRRLVPTELLPRQREAQWFEFEQHRTMPSMKSKKVACTCRPLLQWSLQIARILPEILC